ncbi:hypothetical protein [Hyphomicrobium sp. ghe19]|uniref:hypothetical protein n=1 Tax=Hyphomicrobium sp. ghe19 TaxID=2682968 RepID=UPI0013669254|nr:hypothetical protein HYPP_02399 [Hyphomicrobium sp. ghe19]
MKLVIRKREPGVPLPVVEELVEAPQSALDEKVRREIASNPEVLVPWFLIASYVRQVHSLWLVSAALYDELAAALTVQWDIVEHRYKNLISLEDLRERGLRLTAREYPGVIRSAAQMLVKLHLGIKIEIDWRLARG